MPTYHSSGQIPRKRHSIFRRPDGGLYAEELMGNMGFTGPSSLLYHLHPPTEVRSVRTLGPIEWQAEDTRELKHRHFRTHQLKPGSNVIEARVPVIFNSDVAMSLVQSSEGGDFFYRNAQADEVVFVSEGEGTLESVFGDLEFHPGDYLVIPRSILHRYVLRGPVRMLVIESSGYVRTPKRYRNEYGQLLEHSPYSERDFRKPTERAAINEQGEFRQLVKKDSHLVEIVVCNHPFDVAGWDGYYYPYAFSIHDFEPRVGRFHLPPPIHQTFEGDGFVICSFCPRPYDFDPEAVPAPYNHSNVMSDEVLYYANSEFMSRKGIEYGSVTLHPDGLPHGPQPGRTEASIGKAHTDELAVMVDTFRPLHVSRQALAVEDKDYFRSWLQS